MLLDEMVKLFIDSRKRGVTGARKKAAPKTIEVYTNTLRTLTRFLAEEVEGAGVTDYTALKRLHLIQFLDWLQKQEDNKKWSKATCQQVLRSLRTFFKWVDKDEDCQEAGLKGLQKYMPVIGKTPRRTDIPQMKELKSFKNNFNTANRWGYRDYVATCLMLDTGARLGEVCNLRLDHTLLDDRTMIVDGKTGPRLVPLTEEMVRLLKGWFKRRTTCKTAEGSPYVFISKYGPQMSVNGFGQRFRKHVKKYNLPRISAHSLRHSFATNYLRQGGDMEKLRMMTGHTTYTMLMDYLHLAKVGGKAAHQELEKVSILKEL